MTGTATTLLICSAGLNKVLFELRPGNFYVEYRAALNTTKYFFAQLKLLICHTLEMSVSLCNILFLNPNAMCHYILIGVQRNKSVYKEQSL